MNRTLLLVPASILIIGGVVAALWVLGSASGERSMFSSLEAAPAQADVFFAINTDPTSPQWLAVNKSLDTLNAKDPIRKAIDEALADVNLEWDRDIAPVAGDEAFYSIPDITNFGPDEGWDAGFLLRDPGHAREVFDDLRARDDSPPMVEEEYNGVTIYTTEAVTLPDDQGDTSGDSGSAFEPAIDCGGFGFRADGTPDEDAYGGEPCESDAQYCLWWGFVPTGDEGAPFETAPCAGTSSYCGAYGLLDIATPVPNRLPCGDDFGYLFEGSDSGDIPAFDPADITPSTTAVAFVDNVLALGASADDVKAVIDVVQGRAESAKSNERLQEFRAQQKEDFLMWGYADLADVWVQAEDTLSGSDYSSDVDTHQLFDQLRTTYDRVGFSLSSLREGFAFDLTVLHSAGFDQANAYEPTAAYDPAIAEMLPADTMFYLSTFDIYDQSWLPGKSQWEGLGVRDESVKEALDGFRDETGVDLDSDVFALLTGEVAIAGNVSDLENFDLSLFGVADVNDTAHAERTVETLHDYIRDQIKDSANSDPFWSYVPTDGQGSATDLDVGWYTADGRLVVGYPESAVADMKSGVGATLASTEDWQRTIELLPQDKTFFGYFSVARILDEIRDTKGAAQGFEDSSDGEITLDDLEPIRSIGMAGTTLDNGFGVHFVLFMKDS